MTCSRWPRCAIARWCCGGGGCGPRRATRAAAAAARTCWPCMAAAVGLPMNLIEQIGLLLWKDVVVELRAGELLYGTLLFSAIVVLLFSFAFLGGAPPTIEVMAGVLWVALSLSGLLGVSRSFEREREGDTLRALLLSPISRPALYLAKLLSISLLMLAIVAVVLPGLGLLFGLRTGGHLGALLLVLVLGIVGFAAVAALFAASLGRARAREVLLPILVYPLVVP